MNLFQKKKIKLSSGIKSDFKIECDALTDEDWYCIAYLISKKINFSHVVSVPEGGDKLANHLRKYIQSTEDNLILIVDDVLTTGESMEKTKRLMQIDNENIKGVVLFSRGKCPDWISSVFNFNF